MGSAVSLHHLYRVLLGISKLHMNHWSGDLLPLTLGSSHSQQVVTGPVVLPFSVCYWIEEGGVCQEPAQQDRGKCRDLLGNE